MAGTIVIIFVVTFLFINNTLTKGYAFQMMVAIYAKNDIQVKYVLVNKDATENAQEEVRSTFYESVENKNLDTSSFNLKNR